MDTRKQHTELLTITIPAIITITAVIPTTVTTVSADSISADVPDSVTTSIRFLRVLFILLFGKVMYEKWVFVKVTT